VIGFHLHQQLYCIGTQILQLDPAMTDYQFGQVSPTFHASGQGGQGQLPPWNQEDRIL
jgi:hypothetical protein